MALILKNIQMEIKDRELHLNDEKYIVSIEHISSNSNEDYLKKLILRILSKDYKNTKLEAWTDPDKFIMELSEPGMKSIVKISKF